MTEEPTPSAEQQTVENEKSRKEQRLAPKTGSGLPAKPVNDWQILGETFESMGKVGLALTVGFSAAAVFCKAVDSGKLKVPSVMSLMAQANTSSENEERS